MAIDPAWAAVNPQYVASNPLLAVAAFGGGDHLSAGERYQNELNDRRNQINGYGDIDTHLLQLINGQAGYAEQNTPEQLLQRYGSVYDAQNSDNAHARDAASYANQIFGGQDVINNNAYRTFRSIFGRAPTSTELSQIIPIFGGAEGNTRGPAAVSKMFESYKQSPEYLKTQAGQYYDDLDPTFDTLFGRDATASENDYYGQLLAGGRSPYEIEQMLKQLPEFQQAEDKKFRSGLASELEGYDKSFFDKAQESVISRAARNNGGFGSSSALDFALTNLMGEIAEKRGSYLAGLSSQQYGGNKEAARDDYRGQMGRYYDDQNYQRNRRDNEEDYYRSRADDDRDYQRQFNDFMNSQSRNRGGNNWMGSVLGGAGALAPLGPWGAAAGAGAGLYSWLDR